VAIHIFRRRRELRPLPPSDIGDFYVGSAVRLQWGHAVGWVLWIREEKGTAGVHWNYQAPGKCSIEDIKYLRPAAANPAFGPDVKEDE
jgi:hypothetical protein